eukprot:44373_1
MAALELEWAFGINSNVPNCVHLLQHNDKSEEIIFYPVSNIGIIYNLNTKQQEFLSLHTNIITSSILSSNKELLILGDSGASNNKSLISIWNANTYNLISQYQLPPNFGVQSLAINKQNTLLSAIINESIPSQCNQKNEIVQHLIIWSLIKKYTNENSEIDDTTIEFKLLSQQQIENKSDNNELYHFITMNQDASEIVTHGENINNFIFWSVTHIKNDNEITDEEIELKPYYTQTTDNINNIDLTCIGQLTASTFFPYNNGPVITATNCGDLIVWKYNDKKQCNTEHRIISKIISKITRGSINCLSILNNNNIIVLASSTGCIRFYDFEFRVIGWLNYLGDQVKSISFPLNIPKYNDISTANNQFVVPNMIIGTKKNKIIQVLSTCDHRNDNSDPTHKIIIDTFNTICTSMASHPTLPIIAVGNGNGEIQMWNIENKSIIKIISLSQPQQITDIIFSPNGECMVFATDTDYLRIYDTKQYEEIQCFKTSYDGNICNLCFSLNGEWIAFSQSNRISVYRFWYGINDMKKEKPKEWILIGNYESHNKYITCIHFSYPSGIDDISKRAIPRLFSISNDNLINEYNLHRSSANFGLRLKYTFCLKQMSIPTCIQFIAGIKLNEENLMTYSLNNNDGNIFLPKYNEKYKEYEYIEDRLIVFDDELKLHFYHSPRSVFSSDGRPIYTSDTQTANTNRNRNNDNDKDKDKNQNEQDEKEQIEPITFRKTSIGPSFGAAIKKVIPLDNDMKTFLFCTYDQIIGLMEAPFNGNPNRYVGYIGHPGNINGFEMVMKGKYLITNGGYDKSMLIWKINKNILSEQIIKCNEENNLNNIFIDLLNKYEYEEIKNYFTYVQIENQGTISTVPISISNKINIEQITAIFQAMGCFLTSNDIERIGKEITSRFKNNDNKIDLNQFIQLFINYRSIYEMNLYELHKSFMNIIVENNINREKLMEILQKKGDKMTRDELIECFELLTGYNKKQLNNIMPKNITPQIFIQQILGLNQQQSM